MGGITEAKQSIDKQQDMILEQGRESEKHRLAHQIYEDICQLERFEANNLTKSLDLDVNTRLSKNTSYVNLRTAQQFRNRSNRIEEARRKVEKDVEFHEPDSETEAEKLIK